MLKPVNLKELDAGRRKRILERSRLEVETVKAKVEEILRNVRERGDAALLEYTTLFDGVHLKPEEIRVSVDDRKAAYCAVPQGVLNALKKTAENIRVFHQTQLPHPVEAVETTAGVSLMEVWLPAESVGAYVPRGLASSALMTVIPARLAGVDRVIACTPPNPRGSVEPGVLAALDMAGVDEVYRIGGAQAVAAMTYGTETVDRVDRIVAPGNIYVTAAKLLVQGLVGTDLPRGPSEVLIVADETDDPLFIALDMVSQAEHGIDSVAVLVTTSEPLARAVDKCLEQVIQQSPRAGFVTRSLQANGAILIVESLDEALSFLNTYAPEHLEVLTQDPARVLKGVRNAGSIFLGPYAPVAAGDYATGANHILPTGGAARFLSNLSVTDFMKRVTVQSITREGLAGLSDIIFALAEAEGLPGHGEAVKARLRGGM